MTPHVVTKVPFVAIFAGLVLAGCFAEDDGWVLAEQSPVVCTAQAILLRPGTSETLHKVLQSGLAPGDYRVVFYVSVDEPSQRQSVSVFGRSFHVE